MKNLFQCFLVVLLLLSAGVCRAEVEDDVSYLLTYLAESGCTFIRNGDEHDSNEARDHLEMKYNYAKKRIKTAEDFINKIASKSSLSRKPYHVRCGNVKTLSQQWLQEALEAHRKSLDK